MTNGENQPLGSDVEAVEAMVPEAFIDRTFERYQSLPLIVRGLILLMLFAGVAMAVMYIFGLTHLIGLPSIFDISYYFILMAMYMPMVYLLIPAHKKEKTVGSLSYIPAI